VEGEGLEGGEGRKKGGHPRFSHGLTPLNDKHECWVGRPAKQL